MFFETIHYHGATISRDRDDGTFLIMFDGCSGDFIEVKSLDAARELINRVNALCNVVVRK